MLIETKSIKIMKINKIDFDKETSVIYVKTIPISIEYNDDTSIEYDLIVHYDNKKIITKIYIDEIEVKLEKNNFVFSFGDKFYDILFKDIPRYITEEEINNIVGQIMIEIECYFDKNYIIYKNNL